MFWCIKLAPASAFSFGTLEHFPKKWEKQSEMVLINEIHNMWIYKLRKMKLVLLFFCHHGKLSHRSSGWQVPLLLPCRQAAIPSDRWCFIALTCQGCEEPTANTDPNICLAIPTSSFPSQSSQLLSTPSLPFA